MDPDVGLRIGAIAEDHLSGATALAAKAADIFALAAEVSHAPGETQFLQDMAEVGHVLMNVQPAMTPLFHLTNQMLTAVERAPRDTKRAAVAAMAKGFVASLARRSAKLADMVQAHLSGEDVVLTLSASSTVEASLLKAHAVGRLLRVICAEARPLNEGVGLAQRLAAAGIPVTLVTDALAPSLIREATLALVGADTVCDRGIVNKAGTYALALAAEATATPFIVLATTDKFLPPSLVNLHSLVGEERDPAQILATPIPGVTVENRQFDLTPLNLVSWVVTERGSLGLDEVIQVATAINVHPLLSA